MILSHLKDIKAKIEQKSINNMKLPFEGPFKDKYAGRSPERILCLYSVRLVIVTSYYFFFWLFHGGEAVSDLFMNKPDGVLANCPRTCL